MQVLRMAYCKGPIDTGAAWRDGTASPAHTNHLAGRVWLWGYFPNKTDNIGGVIPHSAVRSEEKMCERANPRGKELDNDKL